MSCHFSCQLNWNKKKYRIIAVRISHNVSVIGHQIYDDISIVTRKKPKFTNFQVAPFFSEYSCNSFGPEADTYIHGRFWCWSLRSWGKSKILRYYLILSEPTLLDDGLLGHVSLLKSFRMEKSCFVLKKYPFF